jgi:hypothetical protein
VHLLVVALLLQLGHKGATLEGVCTTFHESSEQRSSVRFHDKSSQQRSRRQVRVHLLVVLALLLLPQGHKGATLEPVCTTFHDESSEQRSSVPVQKRRGLLSSDAS